MPPLMLVPGGLCLLLVARAAAAGRRPVRTLLAGAVCGVAGLAAVALLAPYTGVSLPLNAFTGFVATVLGLPGVVLLLLIPLI